VADHITDEAVTEEAVDAAKDGYARSIGAADWQALVQKIGTRDAFSAAQVIRAALAAALPVLNTTAADANATRVDELDRWLNAGDVAGYASVGALLNAMRVRRDWLAQGVPAIGAPEIREAIAAELESFAKAFTEGRDALTSQGCANEGAVLGGAAKSLAVRSASLRGGE
jgi:hypothetical protein